MQVKVGKIVQFIMMICMVGCVLWGSAITANAEVTASGTWDNLSWSIENDTLTITGSGEMKDADIKSGEVYPWTVYADTITGIVISDGITRTASAAFSEMSQLTSVSLGNTVKIIGKESFAYCESLKSIVLPNSVTTIEDWAFFDTPQLGDIVFSENLVTIGSSAFYNNYALKELVLPNSVESIGSYAFDWCYFTSVSLGENIKNIDVAAFSCNMYLETFINRSSNTTYVQFAEGSSSLYIPEYYWDDVEVEKINVYASPGSTTEEYVEWYNDNNLKPVLEFVPILNTPDNVSASNLSAGVNISWDKVDGAASYEVYRSTTKASGYNLIKSGVTSTDYLDTTVKSGTTYYYKIVAVRDSVKSEFSAASDAITYLAAPTFKKVVNVVSGVHVYWNAPAGAKTYNVYRSTKKDSGYTLVKSGLTATHYIDTTAKSGTTYYYKIIALKGSVKSAYSKPFNAITYVGTPDITSRFNKGAGVQLGWNKIEGATGYAIYRKPYEGGAWTRVTTIEGNKTFTWMDESVKTNNGTVYKYTIRALAGSDMKTLSGCRSTGRTMARLTSRTLNSATKTSATSIKCNWSTTGVCNGYEVRFMVGDTVYKTFTVGNYKIGVKTFTGLKAGQTYKIQVRSYKKVDGVGTFYSAWSVAKTVRL